MERAHQIEEEGFGPAHDAENTCNDWVAYICAYAGRGVDCYANQRECSSMYDHFRKQMVKVAALAVAAVEAVDRGDLRS